MRHRTPRILPAISLVLILAACSDATGPAAEGPLVRTVAPQFALEIDGSYVDAAIVTTFTNRTGGPLYFDYCPPIAMVLEVRRPNETAWERGFDPIAACPGFTEARRLKPGSARTDTLHLSGCLDDSCYPIFELVPDAEYRVVYGAATQEDLRALLPVEERASNPFHLVVAGGEGSAVIGGTGP